MANYNVLKSAIQNAVDWDNNDKQISGNDMLAILLSIVDNTVASGYLFAGVATPATNPGTPDQKVFYIGSQGTYPNFGPAVIPDGNLAVFYYDSNWHYGLVAFPLGDDAVSTSKVQDGAITLAKLAQALRDELFSSGYKYVGIATPATNPGTPDQNVFYLASTAGTYANFGGLVLADGEIAILKYNGAWSKDSTGAASLEFVNELPNTEDSGNDADLDIADPAGYVLARFKDGHFQTKNFNSAENNANIGIDNIPDFDETETYSVGGVVKYSGLLYKFIAEHSGAWDDADVEQTTIIEMSQSGAEHPVSVEDSGNDADLDIADPAGNVIMRLKGGHVITKNFNSMNLLIRPENIVRIAALDSDNYAKTNADFICTGDNDVDTINMAISSLNGNGKAIFSDGHYYIKKFTQVNDGYAAILLNDINSGNVTLEGEHDTDGYWDAIRVIFVLPQDVYQSLSTTDYYSIIRHDTVNINRHLSVNNIKFEIYNNQKKIICVDALYSGGVNVYNCHGRVTSHPAAWGANPPSDWEIPNDDCVFFRGLSKSQNSNDLVRYSTGWCFGVAFAVQGEHLALDSCAGVCCKYGFVFNKYASAQSGGAYCHPMMLTNCLEEMCHNFPKFYGNGLRQSVRIINYHVEWKPNWFALGGDYAIEDVLGTWYGFINYAIQSFGTEYNLRNSPKIPFWGAGYGSKFISINDAQATLATSTERNEYAPNFGQQVYDLTLNKLCICKNTNPITWVDANGQNI